MVFSALFESCATLPKKPGPIRLRISLIFGRRRLLMRFTLSVELVIVIATFTLTVVPPDASVCFFLLCFFLLCFFLSFFLPAIRIIYYRFDFWHL